MYTTDSTLVEVAVTHFLENKGSLITDCLIDIGFCNSKAEAKRAILQGSVKLGKYKVSSPSARVFNFINCTIAVDIDSDNKYNVITSF
jgi:predicted rRNA methylase YqxC with S4 and FtsJ domains